MEPHSLQFFADAAGAEVKAADPGRIIRRVITDSRLAGPGDLFVALRGERFDGHDFLTSVHQQGAVAVVSAASRDRVPALMPRLIVDSPREAYAAFARAHRRQFTIPVICVAGSNGKTTTKEMIAAVLGAGLTTLKSDASFNNDIGLPASLLRLESQHQAAVFEVGTNHPGELAPLVRLAMPRLGVITSIGREHLEFFGDLSSVAAEEGVLAELLPSGKQGGVLFLPGECPFANHLASRTSARVVRTGFGVAQSWRADVGPVTWSGTRFTLHSPIRGWSGEWVVPLPGRHSVSNAILALAVACELGIDPTAARNALASFIPAQRRLNMHSAGGIRVIDDTYNANADSVLAALQTLADLPCTGRRVAVLGDMAELGPMTETAHAEVGRAAARLGIDSVFAIGRNARITSEASGPSRGQNFAQIETALPAIEDFVREGDSVLVKASRSSGLERIIEGLMSLLIQRENLDSDSGTAATLLNSVERHSRISPTALV